MALSILSYDGEQVGLWCSTERRWLSIQPKAYRPVLDQLKHDLDAKEQRIDNRLYFEQLRGERIALLVNGGMTPDAAAELLQQKQPYLFTQATPVVC
jgi:hypothetical protein